VQETALRTGSRATGEPLGTAAVEATSNGGSARPDADAWLLDRAKLRRMLANEADMSFKGRSLAVYEFLEIGAGDRVLDMGCGRGFYLRFTRELYPEADVTGIELEPHLLVRARREVPGVRVAAADVYELPFPDGAFDRIMFTEVLEHIPDDRRALRELHRVLAPGGVIALTTPNADYPWAWDPINKTLESLVGRPIRKGVLSGIWANHVRLYRLEDLCRTVADAGFRVEELRCITRFCFPFIHNLVYGIGKELMEAGALPASMARAADRFEVEPSPGSPLNPVRIGLAAFNLVDRLNDLSPPRADRPYLITALKLRKPGEASLDEGRTALASTRP